ncbi:zinc ribbon domain-containing protein [Streptomyces sp. NPDC058583]|uniref:zinc ribbon domain-containing protein n=1 Tax=unclassified Streptomyces TaxID=2593676 RepID=UPI0036695705
MSETMKCTHCGALVDPVDAFCAKCGGQQPAAGVNDATTGKGVEGDSVTPKAPGGRTAPSRSGWDNAFPWVFGGVQILFLVWLIASQNYSNKVCPYGEDCANVGNTALLLVVGLWVAVDAILIAIYASRKRKRSLDPPVVTDERKPAEIKVVEDYFAAINARNYARAWELGGKNLVGGAYDSYVEGFSGTVSVSVTIYSLDGDRVTLRHDALQADGTHRKFGGTYTVRDGAITAAKAES